MTARVAVTTTAGRASARVGALLSSAALDPVYLPCIRVEPASVAVLDRLRREAVDANWIVLTSRRAVEVLWPDSRMPSGPAVAAVGPSSAEAARSAGGRVQLVGEAGAASLVRDLLPRVDGSSVVFPFARGTDPETVRSLADRAGRLVADAAYDTVPVPPGDDAVDAVIFGSPSAVRGWRLARTLDDLVAAAIGETTAACLRETGHPPAVVPGRPRMEMLVTALADHLRDRERSRT